MAFYDFSFLSFALEAHKASIRGLGYISFVWEINGNEIGMDKAGWIERDRGVIQEDGQIDGT